MGNLSVIKKLCKERNVRISKLERDLGLPNASFSGLKNENVTFDRVVLVADYFGVPLDLFVEMDNRKSVESTTVLNAREAKLINLFRSLNEEGKEKIMQYADDLADTGKYIKTNQSVVEEVS